MKLLLSPLGIRGAFLLAMALAAIQPVSAALAIAKAAPPSATAGTPYSFPLTATGGTPPYSWTLLSGSLPIGLNLTSAGVITGTAAVEGSWAYNYPYSLYVGVTDANGSNAARTYNVTLLAPSTTTYTLTVVGGSGGGSFPAGTSVTLSANAPPAGDAFAGWTGAVSSAATTITTLIMPSANTIVTANFAPAAPPPPATYTLTVNNGNGGGSYPAGTVVKISAAAEAGGQAFSNWSGAIVASATSPATTITMPAANTAVTANYFSSVVYSANGATSGSVPSDPSFYAVGDPVTVPGNLGYLFKPGQSFTGWTTAPDGSGASYAPGASFAMGSAAVTLYAQWNNADWPVSVWGGARNAITLMADGSVWTWGFNSNGQLGDGTTTDRPFPVQVLGPGGVGNLTGITAVMGGELHNLALKSDGTVWAWGRNLEDQLGDGNSTDSSTPVQVSGLSSIVALGGRAYHSLALKSDGTVWAWGWDYHGALGIGVADQNYDYPAPVQVQGLNHPLMLTSGYCFSVALLQDHTLVAWGNNGNGELGDGTTTDRYTPVPVAGISDVIWVSAGWGQVVAIKSDGTVWTWGANSWQGNFPGSGLLGDGTTADHSTPERVQGLSGAIQAFGGDSFTAVLLHDGTVWTFGSNGAGQLGTGSFALAQSLVPVQVQGLGNIVAISGRDHHNQALRADGTIWSWGSGLNGEMGNGTTQNSAIPVEVEFGGSAPPPPPPPPPPATYQLNVVNGAGSGAYAAGTMVSISANPAPGGQVFGSWSGATVASPFSPTTTLTVPAASTTVTAIYVAAAPVTTSLSIPAQSLANATAGASYSQALTASGGTPPYHWTLLAGGLPSGLALTSAGLVSGTPTVLGSWAYNYPYQSYLQVTDSNGAAAAISLPMTLLPP